MRNTRRSTLLERPRHTFCFPIYLLVARRNILDPLPTGGRACTGKLRAEQARNIIGLCRVLRGSLGDSSRRALFAAGLEPASAHEDSQGGLPEVLCRDFWRDSGTAQVAALLVAFWPNFWNRLLSLSLEFLTFFFLGRARGQEYLLTFIICFNLLPIFNHSF